MQGKQKIVKFYIKTSKELIFSLSLKWSNSESSRNLSQDTQQKLITYELTIISKTDIVNILQKISHLSL